jgi:nitroimidazol reductase NimA-like FMN-containing flavoprotein (pyridoxamine 5'-phosphate oxidase superfamily)
MSDTSPTEMTTEERDAFLGAGGTGVLSLASGEGPPHAIPVSYGYDAEGTTFYFRLAVGPDSGKGELADRPVTFVSYGREDTAENWRSVVAKGRLEATTEESAALESLEGLQQVHIPLVDIFGRPARDVPFEFYRLVPDELTGRQETSTAV